MYIYYENKNSLQCNCQIKCHLLLVYCTTDIDQITVEML